jgi:hypothetical protein
VKAAPADALSGALVILSGSCLHLGLAALANGSSGEALDHVVGVATAPRQADG